MIDQDLEQALWNDPFPIVKKILDAMVVWDDTVVKISKEAETKRLFAGEWNGEWHLGDNDNAFNSRKIIRAIRPPETRMHVEFKFSRMINDAGIHKGMFKPLDEENPEYAKFILEGFFRIGSQLDLVKSRWTPPRNKVIEHCWSLQDACNELKIDPWKFALMANL